MAGIGHEGVVGGRLECASKGFAGLNEKWELGVFGGKEARSSTRHLTACSSWEAVVSALEAYILVREA